MSFELESEDNETHELFFDACRAGDIEKVKELLTSNLVDIHAEDDAGLRVACDNGKLEVVKYLLASPELKEHANIHAKNNSSLRIACIGGDLELLKYLLTSPDLKEHINVHVDNDRGFLLACKFSRFDIIHYLIFDMNIENTESIQEGLATEPKNSEQVERWFEQRELNRVLNKELKINPTENKKLKL